MKIQTNNTNNIYTNKKSNLAFKGNPVQRFANGINSDGFIKRISSPSFSKWSVAGIITLNMITRPAFTLTNKDVDKSDRIYSAARVGVQEFIGLMSHLFLASVFELAGFKLAKKFMKDNKDFIKDNTFELAKKSNSQVVKGSIALGSMLGSVAALAFIAPNLNNMFLPSLLKAVGIKINDKNKKI